MAVMKINCIRENPIFFRLPAVHIFFGLILTLSQMSVPVATKRKVCLVHTNNKLA